MNSTHAEATPPRTPPSHTRLVALLLLAGILITIGLLTYAPTAGGLPYSKALGVVLRDGPIAFCIIAAATGVGLWIVRGLREKAIERRWRLMLAAALGLGATSLLMLGLGTIGLLNRWLWIGLLGFFAAGGLLRWRDFERDSSGGPAEDVGHWHWLWLVAIGFAAFSIIAATMPPGLLWIEEGRGYDVLEYHFGAPRDYFDAGRISYLPHNIYSNFPFNVEMLYLLAMVLHGDPIAAIYTANLLNVVLALLAVAAVWLAARELGRRSGIVAGVLAATCPFLVYLCGVAYVENGLLLFAAMAAATALRGRRLDSSSGGWAFTVGLLAGLACGCKYTALPTVVLPIGSFVLLSSRDAWRCKVRRALPFVIGTAITFAPWLAKNLTYTGNPVFPLAYEYLGAREGLWNDDGASRWAEGHRPAPEDRPIGPRLARLANQVIFSKYYGPLLALGLVSGILFLVPPVRAWAFEPGRLPSPFGGAVAIGELNGTRTSAARLCWLWIAAVLVWWTFFSHLADRFAVVMIIPCAILVSIWASAPAGLFARIMSVLILVVAGWNLSIVWNWFTDPRHARLDGRTSFLALDAFGETGAVMSWPHIHQLNTLASEGHRVLMIGDARRFYFGPGVDYCVIFNRNPFAEAAERLSPGDLLGWLKERQYAYVYVDWAEMDRLRTTRYGFWESITPGLFEALMRAGLKLAPTPQDWPEFATLYHVTEAHADG